MIEWHYLFGTAGSRDVRLIVLSRIPEEKKNAIWLMFSAKPEKVKYGAANYSWHQPVSSIINQLFEKYSIEGVAMPYTIQDYLTDVKNEVLNSLTPEDISVFLERIGPEKFLKGLKPEDRLKGLKPEEIKDLLRKFH